MVRSHPRIFPFLLQERSKSPRPARGFNSIKAHSFLTEMAPVGLVFFFFNFLSIILVSGPENNLRSILNLFALGFLVCLWVTYRAFYLPLKKPPLGRD